MAQRAPRHRRPVKPLVFYNIFPKCSPKCSRNCVNIFLVFVANFLETSTKFPKYFLKLSITFLKFLQIFSKFCKNFLISHVILNFFNIYRPIQNFLIRSKLLKIFLMFHDNFGQIIIEASSIISSNFFQNHSKPQL